MHDKDQMIEARPLTDDERRRHYAAERCVALLSDPRYYVAAIRNDNRDRIPAPPQLEDES